MLASSTGHLDEWDDRRVGRSVAGSAGVVVRRRRSATFANNSTDDCEKRERPHREHNQRAPDERV